MIIDPIVTCDGLVEAFWEKFPFLTNFDNSVLQVVRDDLERVKGKTVRIFETDFARNWTTEEGRAVQKANRLDGNASVFLRRLIQSNASGQAVSIANTDDRLVLDEFNQLTTPWFVRSERVSALHLNTVGNAWRPEVRLVSIEVV
jgi:hypothetical protein